MSAKGGSGEMVKNYWLELIGNTGGWANGAGAVRQSNMLHSERPKSLIVTNWAVCSRFMEQSIQLDTVTHTTRACSMFSSDVHGPLTLVPRR